jgi:hypothetical protein
MTIVVVAFFVPAGCPIKMKYKSKVPGIFKLVTACRSLSPCHHVKRGKLFYVIFRDHSPHALCPPQRRDVPSPTF